MRVKCQCGCNAIINTTNRLSNDHAELYCSCTDPHCGHTFVVNLSYSHTLSPSSKTVSTIVSGLMRAMSPEQLQQLQQEMNFS